jgi:hypothetical protein
MWLRVVSGVWLGGDAGHSGQSKTAPEQGGFDPDQNASIQIPEETKRGRED